MTVDVHAHAIIPRYHDLLDGLGVAAPGYGSGSGLVAPAEDVRISLMDEAGVDRQLLSAMSARMRRTKRPRYELPGVSTMHTLNWLAGIQIA